MKHYVIQASLAIALVACTTSLVARAGQSPGSATAADIPMSHRDRVYAAEQFSNTVSVTDPVSNQLLGVIRLGDPAPASFSALYHGQLLVHGMGFSPDHRTLAVVSVGSNSVTFIDTASNSIKHTTYVGRSPHEAFFTPDGTEVWVTIRGENYVLVLDASSYQEKARISTPNGPGMQIFSPDGRYAYICSSFNPETIVVATKTHDVVGKVKQDSPFCPNIAATPDGRQVWLTLKDVGETMVFDAKPPFALLKTLATGPVSNHVNFVRLHGSTLAYVTVGGLNQVQVYRTDDFSLVSTISVGNLPHGLWPSGDGTRVYVGLENDDALMAIDTSTNAVVATVPIGQAPQAVVYVPDAVPEGSGTAGLQQLGLAGNSFHLKMRQVDHAVDPDGYPTSVALFDQGLIQVLAASVTRLTPRTPYVLALAEHSDGSGQVESLATFTSNASGAAVVNAVGPIRQIVRGTGDVQPRYLVIAEQTTQGPGRTVQVLAP